MEIINEMDPDDRIGMDPATSSTPFVATFIDVTGIVIYFNIAMWVLGGKLF